MDASTEIRLHPNGDRGAQGCLLVLLRRLCESEVAVTGAEDDRLVAHQVVDRDAVLDRVNESPVTAVGGRPDGAADGGGGVASSGSELAVSARVQQLERLLTQGRR